LSDDTARQFREVQAYFGLPSVALVEKDLQVVRAITAIAAIDATPFTLVFGGGTALARAHKLVRRMSEDVDFKIVPKAAAPVSRNGLHRALAAVRERTTQALHAAGFAFDAKDETYTKSRNESRYTIWNLPYESESESGAGDGLRPTIQIEMTYAPLRRLAVMRDVSSFVAEAHGYGPEISGLPCVGLTETAADKLVALTRRTAMDIAGLTRGPTDPALVRHIYDLHMMLPHVDADAVSTLAADIAKRDAEEFRNQYPAYAADIAGESAKALTALATDGVYRHRYSAFIEAMVYGERPSFEEALPTVLSLARQAWVH
jgi:hypothetical protein